MSGQTHEEKEELTQEEKEQDSHEAQGAVLLTGASSGIGQAIARRLCAEGRTVYGIARHFPPETREFEKVEHRIGTESDAPDSEDPVSAAAPADHGTFHPVVCDLLHTGELLDTVKKIRQETRIDTLINNAGCACYGLHETLRPEEIQEIVRTDLEAPMLLTREFLPDFKQHGGTLVYIASVTATHFANPHGAAYGAAKAGLLSFTRSIFEESRKYNVRVTTILPDMTQTNLYRHADFEADPTPACSLTPEEVADAVLYTLHQPAGVDIPELTITPQLHRIRKKQG